MSEEIKDGSGTGNKAKVDDNNRLHVQALTMPHELAAARIGDAYNLNTGLISITADATLMYIKNNKDQDLIIEAIALGSLGGATHTTKPYITIVKNPTGGNLISDATAIDMNENRNFGSSRVISADVFKGKVGGTVTGGEDLGILQTTTSGRSLYTIDLILPKGSSMAFKLTTDIGATSENWYAAIICHNVSAI